MLSITKRVIASAVIVLFMAICMVGCGGSAKSEATVPAAAKDLRYENYQDVIQLFEGAGFTNITTEKIEDLITGWWNKDGEVKEVSVGGHTDFIGDEKFPVDTKVVIRYHTFPASDESTETEDKEEPEKQEQEEKTDTEKATDPAQPENDSFVLKPDENGVWYYYNGKGKIQSHFTGIVANEAGSWMVENGKVNFDYEGTFMDDKGMLYTIVGGKVTGQAETDLSSLSMEYKNALAKAQSYSDHMNMSKQSLYDQLTSEYGEGFAADAAQFAVDHVNANYNANALEKGKSYQSGMNMSKSAVYEQLTSSYGEGFTASQAQYAVDHLPD